jgi:hypothetical protein
VLDWWPFQPYMTPLAQDQIRLCPVRWHELLPRAFDIKV